MSDVKYVFSKDDFAVDGVISEKDQKLSGESLMSTHFKPMLRALENGTVLVDKCSGPSTFTPDDSRRLQLQGFVGSVCVGSTGRLGIVTHVQVENGEWTACGFGLDGKGIWTSCHPTELGTAEAFYHKLKTRFHGRLSALDCLSRTEIDNIAAAVVLQMGPGAEVGYLSDKLESEPLPAPVELPAPAEVDAVIGECFPTLNATPPAAIGECFPLDANMPLFGGKIREDVSP